MKKFKGVKHEVKKPAMDLKKIPFPQCAKSCKALSYFGVCECENICPFKFEKE